MDSGYLQTGQTLWVQGTSGVSICAAQIATAHGARVIAISGSDGKLTKVKALIFRQPTLFRVAVAPRTSFDRMSPYL
jgi:NADPH:quinone reductase-like Zn-dependent oxidoreductase